MSQRGNIRTQILHELVKAGIDGLTDSQLAAILSANKNHIPTRRRDVELNGLCKKSVFTRLTDTGTFAIVHLPTEAGIAFAATGKEVPTRPKASVEAESKTINAKWGIHNLELTETVEVGIERGDLATPKVTRYWRVLDKDGIEIPLARLR